MEIRKLDHVGIRLLGFQVTREDYNEHVVVMKHPGGIEINLLDSGNNDNSRKNITITEGPVTFGDGKTSIFIRDPDLNVIEFTELPKA